MLLFSIYLKNNKTFKYINKCEETYKKLKEYLVTPLILTRLKLEEVLYIYLMTFDKVVSLVLVKEEEGNYKPIYFTS